jgi:hypothetical protein
VAEAISVVCTELSVFETGIMVPGFSEVVKQQLSIPARVVYSVMVLS